MSSTPSLKPKKTQYAILVLALMLIGATASGLVWLRAHQRLGKPGVKATANAGTLVMNIELPEQVLDFTSTNVPESEVELNYFPKDTSYARRMYQLPDGFQTSATVVMMGADRTSIHKPDFCLPGQGWTINKKRVETIPLASTGAQLPVARWDVSNNLPDANGNKVPVSGIYMFWFVADNEQTTDNNQRIWWLARDFVRSGVLQRWAYISFFSYCAPGDEDATFEKMKRLIGAATPEFQLSAMPGAASVAAKDR